MSLVPETDCRVGVSHATLKGWMDESQFERFEKWIYGQTVAICSPDDKNPCDEPHGVVYYRWDIRRFLDGLPVID